MSPESPSIAARLRAALAAILAWMSGAAHRMEAWTARSSRPLVIGLVALAVLTVGVVGIFVGGRFVAHAWRDDPRPAHARQFSPRQPWGKPHDGFHGRPVRRPDAPRPPAPPAPLPPAEAPQP